MKTKILPLVLVFVVLPIALLMLLWHDRCKETVITSSLSPDGQMVAVVSNKNCGPAVAVATEVRLGAKDPRSEINPKAGTTQALLIQGPVQTRLNWRSARQLEIAYPAGSVVVSRRTEIEGVKLLFGDL